MNSTSIEKAFESFRPYIGKGRPYILAVGTKEDGSIIGPWSLQYLKPVPGICGEMLNRSHYFGYPLERGVNNLILGINDPNLSFSEINGFLQKLKMMAKDDKDCIEISCIILKETGYTTIND